MSAHPTETEIKLRVDDAASARAVLEATGFQVSEPRVFEGNDIYDTPDLRLRTSGCLLRLREAGQRRIMTYKGPALPGRHKSRPEIEVAFENSDAMRAILEALGYRRVFRYEKYRTEYARPSEPGVATLDETPIGTFMELEGPAEWIDTVARQLGKSDSDYVLASYATLFLQFKQANPGTGDFMVFRASQE